MVLQIYTDGGSVNNPGQAAYAFVLFQDSVMIFSYGERIGVATNNVAEYTGLIKAFEKVKELMAGGKLAGLSQIYVYSDSSLMVNQLNGLFKVKNAAIREFIMKVRILESELKTPIQYIHILREKNALADSLVKKALAAA